MFFEDFSSVYENCLSSSGWSRLRLAWRHRPASQKQLEDLISHAWAWGPKKAKSPMGTPGASPAAKSAEESRKPQRSSKAPPGRHRAFGVSVQARPEADWFDAFPSQLAGLAPAMGPRNSPPDIAAISREETRSDAAGPATQKNLHCHGSTLQFSVLGRSLFVSLQVLDVGLLPAAAADQARKAWRSLWTSAPERGSDKPKPPANVKHEFTLCVKTV